MSERLGTTHWPVELRLKTAEKVLEIDFDNGARFRLPAEYLRVESPSAEVQGHGPGEKQALLEAADATASAKLLIALIEMAAHGGDDGNDGARH